MAEPDDAFDLVRGNLGFGRKPKRKGPRGLNAIAAHRPVDIHHYDEATGGSSIETIQDPEPILADNDWQRLNFDGYTPSKDMKRVASIPLVWCDWLYAKKGINVMDPADGPKLFAILDDPDFARFRTSEGRISKKAYREFPTAKEGWLKR